ncbi:MAG: hypothetical protein JST92_08600 [Deltaproteobacteria bacterium]|nr:hypothetical protein [Deltaproteobacteria bacterium]
MLLAAPDATGPASTVVVTPAMSGAATSTAATPAPTTKLDFDLLGAGSVEAPSEAVQEKLGQRRIMLTAHQTIGIGLVALTAGSILTGQFNYNDKFGGANTGKWELAHEITTVASLTTFAAAGLLAWLAPVPIEKKTEGIDRVTIHKWSMLAATGGMVAQGVLGFYTASREGYVNQSSMASAHLVIGYATFAAMALAVGALVF